MAQTGLKLYVAEDDPAVLDSGTLSCPPDPHPHCLELGCEALIQGRQGPRVLTGPSAHEAAAAVTEGGLAEGDFMEAVQEGQAQLGADGAGAEQVFRQLLSAEGATPTGQRPHLSMTAPPPLVACPRSLLLEDPGARASYPWRGGG